MGGPASAVSRMKSVRGMGRRCSSSCQWLVSFVVDDEQPGGVGWISLYYYSRKLRCINVLVVCVYGYVYV